MANNYGEGLRIIKFTEADHIEFDKAGLEGLLLHPDVKNRKIVMVSIVGAFRKGKSLYLNYCLRYLYANYKSIKYINNPLNNKNNWSGGDDEPLKGFPWRSGTTRETSGIVFWSDVFLADNVNGKDLAIVLMDTQGLFDNETSSSENSKIFSLSTLMSSVQIVNLQGIIQENDLEYLQFATEYARYLNTNDKVNKPFQNLMFLIRDWNTSHEYNYGMQGGENYLETVLRPRYGQQEHMIWLRDFINSSFSKLSCCLLPHPGKYVATNKKFDGRKSDMDEEFLEMLEYSIEVLFKPENLVPKDLNGIEVNGSQVNAFYQEFIATVRYSKTLQTQSIFNTTMSNSMLVVEDKCFDIYKQALAGKLSESATWTNNDDSQKIATKIHEAAKIPALAAFAAAKKMGSATDEENFKKKLIARMNNHAEEWKILAQLKIAKVKQGEATAAQAALESKEMLRQIAAAEQLARDRNNERERTQREAALKYAYQQAELARLQGNIKTQANKY